MTKQRPHRAGRQRESHIGKMMVLYRAANGWTTREMAPMIGTSHATLSRLERGYAMDADTLMKLMRWLIAEAQR